MIDNSQQTIYNSQGANVQIDLQFNLQIPKRPINKTMYNSQGANVQIDLQFMRADLQIHKGQNNVKFTGPIYKLIYNS